MKITKTGYISLQRQVKPAFARTGDTPWFQSLWREGGLWGCSLHGFGLRFELIGPFRIRVQ